MKKQNQILTGFVAGAAAIALASCGGSDSQGGPTRVLEVELPQELSVGTPVDLSGIASLPPRELEDDFRPEPVQVPESAVLLSRGKPVTSSDEEEPFEGELSYITDGEKDGNEGFSVIISPGPQWVQIDLEQEALVDAVVVWHYFMNDRVVNDVIIQVSNDPTFESGVTTIFNNAAEGDTTELAGVGSGTDPAFIGTYHGRQIAGNGARGQYVRLWSNGNSDNRMNEYIEVEVWGRPAQ